ncbi:MAG: hypothetical protein FRX49_09808 [Trebouxia sp. A1-2]|nr:MAG: hypothetical protein FRX49_09808 [Trebouxia sp. A1-2]
MVNAEVAIFARLPVAGKVKTRLAAGVGFENAATFYKACAEHIFAETSRIDHRDRAQAQKGHMCVMQALVIGTDIPDISASILDRAVAALESHQLVLGPAFDGGYYLLGTTCAALQLFEGIEWSSDKVLQQTLQQAKALQLNVAPLDTLPTLEDIDTLQTLHGHELADLGKGITEPEGRSPTHTVQPQLWFGKELHLLQLHLN